MYVCMCVCMYVCIYLSIYLSIYKQTRNQKQHNLPKKFENPARKQTPHTAELAEAGVPISQCSSERVKLMFRLSETRSSECETDRLLHAARDWRLWKLESGTGRCNVRTYGTEGEAGVGMTAGLSAA